MQARAIRRAVVAAVTMTILATLAAFADTVPADGDSLTTGNQAFIDLGSASPGQVVTWPVDFRLTCGGLSHAAVGSTITLDLASATVPLDGHVSATTATIGPVPSTWTAPSQGCPSPTQTLLSNAPSVVSFTMPTTAGLDDIYTLMWSRTGTTGISGTTAMTFQVDVVGNTAPTLHLPSDQLVEATSAAGAVVTYAATATDAEDATAPTPSCSPASGSTFPLGMTTVQCLVTDGGGLSASGSFIVAVEDTTVPTIHDLPADQSLTTSSQTGTTLTYAMPSASDLADPTPAIDCAPTSGSHIPVGTTIVTCTAIDATGNHTSASFHTIVNYVPPVTWTAVWGEPIATTGSTFVANPGRTVPVKVQVRADGVEVTTGHALLWLASCDGVALSSMPLSWGGGRWNGNLDTGALGGPGCYVATATLDGNVAGSFQIDLRGTTNSSIKAPKPRR